MNDDDPKLATWKLRYRWITWLGIALNLAVALPLVFFPHWMLSLTRVGSDPVTWAQFFGVLLTILSVFYIPAALDVDKYRWYAWAAVGSRLAGVIFATYAVVFLDANDAFLLAVLIDGTIALLQTIALVKLSQLEHGWNRKSQVGTALFLLLATVSVPAVVAWHKFFHEYPQQIAAAPSGELMIERFNHASIGTEKQNGIPYWLWLTMPVVFPEHLPKPGGYASLGFLWQEGDSLPIGFSRKKIGYERIGITCAVCHTGAVQVPGEPRPRIFAGGVGNTLDLLAYQRFLFDCAKDERFNAATIMPEIARMKQLSWIDELLYRWVLIPATRKALLAQSEQWSWAFEPYRDPWGRGRIEPFNPVKRNVINVAVGTSLGTSDMQPLWNLDDVPNRAYHWDGLNTSLTEVVQSGALGDGATPRSIPLRYLDELEQWLRLRQAPKWPFEPPDPKLVERGSELFASERCANCHGPKGALTGQVTPAAEVGTDPNRAEMWTSAAAHAYNDYLDNRPWKFKYFRSTSGYLNVPLDGLWARAPYLHNGSVPTLADLLEPAVKRPRLFWRGIVDYDQERGGFVAQDEKAQRLGSRYDTGLRGNGNCGHEYGTNLPAEDKQALVAYLKTL